MIGNTRKHLSQTWRSFHFNGNAETIDIYVQRIRLVAVMPNYSGPHILEEFKNIMLSHLYSVLFPIENLGQAVETVKRILTKTNLDRQ